MRSVQGAQNALHPQVGQCGGVTLTRCAHQCVLEKSATASAEPYSQKMPPLVKAVADCHPKKGLPNDSGMRVNAAGLNSG
jgi:hypothetical protein